MNEGSVGERLEPNTLVAAAHELKTPLAIIAQLAAGIEDLPAAGQRQALQRIQLSAARSLRLVSGLTTVYKLDNTQQLALQFQLEPVNVRHVCEEAMHEMIPFASQYGQSLRLRTARSQLVVANRDLLYCMIFNLLDNAVRHSQPQTDISLQLKRQHEWVRMAVEDTGPGVQAGDVAHLAQTIGTRPQPIQSHAGTSGLGLYIVGRLAAVMGGRLGMGRPKEGSAFFVDLRYSAQLSLL